MHITLTQDDFGKLTLDAQQEVLALITGGFDDIIRPTGGEHEFKGLSDLTYEMVQKFMEGVGYWTKKRLRLITEEGGRASWECLDEMTNGELNQGFQSGVTRRVRNILNDPNAALLGWRDSYDSNGEPVLQLGEFYVTPTTHKSLKRWFDENEALTIGHDGDDE